ncbi:hypothetical protein [Adhaeribacter pallidiroseus]|uniref:Large tegument protein deneddylase n=1 Tax=Adhaeribacter pallidiroseus TaxID=2072847 RepID=A0A369QL50_9BACT|nr:hypothetical protein [Adhaeribacter pallidiroseus]RDC65070.1 Large tegument protein deneddylase [Adhaeribacter pallidiroseus]
MAKKTTAKKSFSNKQLLMGALGAGTLLAFLTNSAGAAPKLKNDTAPVPTPNPVPAPNPTPKPNPTPAPKPDPYTGISQVVKPGQTTPVPSNPLITKNTVFPASQSLVYAFVDSLNGESIYRGIQATYNVFTGNGVSKILGLSNGQYVGILTGRNGQGMSEIFHSIGNLQVNFWIATSEIKTMYGTQAQALLKSSPAIPLSAAQQATIKDFFLKS